MANLVPYVDTALKVVDYFVSPSKGDDDKRDSYKDEKGFRVATENPDTGSRRTVERQSKVEIHAKNITESQKLHNQNNERELELIRDIAQPRSSGGGRDQRAIRN